MGASGSSPRPGEAPLFGSRSQLDESSESSHRLVLIVEDNESDIYLIREALSQIDRPLTLHVLADGEKAIRFLDQADSNPEVRAPALVILDINLPKRHGGEVLRHLRQSATCAQVPVIVVSTSNSERDRAQMAQFGANAYFRKPSEYDEFMKLGEVVAGWLSDSSAV